jgi:hypothetical protein
METFLSSESEYGRVGGGKVFVTAIAEKAKFDDVVVHGWLLFAFVTIVSFAPVLQAGLSVLLP